MKQIIRVTILVAAQITMLTGCDQIGVESPSEAIDQTHVEETEASEAPEAGAVLLPTEGNDDVAGSVTFKRLGDAVQMHVDISGLAPHSAHSFRIDEGGDCDADSMNSAGEEAPLAANGRDVGDMGDFTADDRGRVDVTRRLETLSVGGDQRPSVVGHAIVVHAGPHTGDQSPAGAAEPIACGVVGPPHPPATAG